jgi:hypothetical protein
MNDNKTPTLEGTIAGELSTLRAEIEAAKKEIERLKGTLYELLADIKHGRLSSMGGFHDTYVPQINVSLIEKIEQGIK